MKKIPLRLILILAYLSLFKIGYAQESKHGCDLPPRGTVKVLIVFAELVGSSPDVGPASNNWPTGTLAPPNADKLLDYAVSATPTNLITKYYKDISLGEYNVIGDYYDGTVQVPVALYAANGDQSAIMQLNSTWVAGAGGQYYTKHGLTLNDFDDYQAAASGILKQPGNPDGKVDVVVVLWRNKGAENSSCTSGWGVGNTFYPSPTLKNKTAYYYGAWNFCPDKYNNPNDYDGFFILEYFHALFGGNHFHTGGGASNGTFMFNFIPSFSTTAQNGSVSNIVCGWDRQYLGWKGSRQYTISALNQSGQEVNSDISIASSPNVSYYVLRDFVTVGDAVRIKLPHFNWQQEGDKKNQYFWIENHQKVNQFDKNKGCIAWTKGLYCYIQVGKDVNSGPNIYWGSDAAPNGLKDWLFPINAEGRWDFFYSLSDNNLNPNNCVWGNFSTPYSTYYPNGTRKPNPFTGFSDGNGLIDSDNNGQIGGTDKWFPCYQKWLGTPTVGSPPFPTIPWWGDDLDAFATTNQKIGIATNPSLTPVYTLMQNASSPSNYDNRSIHLNNLSVEIINSDYYNVGASGPKAILIAVKWDDKAIDNDVRWCGNVVLKNDPLDPLARGMQINISPNKIITVDKGLSPTLPNEITAGSRNFSDPSFLHLLSGTTTTLGAGSQLKITNGSTLHVQAGANLIIGANAKVDVDATSIICIEDGANVVFQDPTSQIVINGKVYGWNYNLQNIVLATQPASYYALNTISTTNVSMPASGNVLLEAKASVTISPGAYLAVNSGQKFEANINNPSNCSNVGNYNLRLINDGSHLTSNKPSDKIFDDINSVVNLPENRPDDLKKANAGTENIEVYPNPTKGSFKLRLTTKEQSTITTTDVFVYDVLGSLVYSKLKVILSTELEISLAEKPSGIYIVKLVKGSEEKNIKIIKQE